MKHISNVLDCKDSDGKWIRSYSNSGIQYTTIAGLKWNKINERCKHNSPFQSSNKTYIGCTNGFINFQEFAEWCQSQYGYLNKDINGHYWHLDKDLLVYGNKVYSPNTCLFVPHRANTLLNNCGASRGNYPLGVNWNKHARKFIAYHKHRGESRHLGCHLNPFDAHRTWQRAKIDYIRDLVKNDIEIATHTQLAVALHWHADRIEADLIAGRQTM